MKYGELVWVCMDGYKLLHSGLIIECSVSSPFISGGNRTLTMKPEDVDLARGLVKATLGSTRAEGKEVRFVATQGTLVMTMKDEKILPFTEKRKSFDADDNEVLLVEVGEFFGIDHTGCWACFRRKVREAMEKGAER